MSTVGIIANPAAGKDIRRLVAFASPTSDAAKIGIIRRAVLGAIESGVDRVLLAPDRHRLTARAVDDLSAGRCSIELLDEPVYGHSTDTTTMAAIMAKQEVGAIVVLGGDGTHRDVAKGWLDAPIVAVSTGTNNVFPRSVDATLAGLAAGLVATGTVALHHVSHQATVAHVSFDDSSADDLALVELAKLDDAFVGARAVWDASSITTIVACIAEPASVGLSSIPAQLLPVKRDAAGGVVAQLGRPPGHRVVRTLIAPGCFADVAVHSVAALREGDSVTLQGPGVLAFDGERDRQLARGRNAVVQLRRDGPRVIDVGLTIEQARVKRLPTPDRKD